MPFENITVTQYTTSSGTITGPDSTAAMTKTLTLNGVAAGAALAVIGTIVMQTGWPYAELRSVTDTNGDTWGEIDHLNSGIDESETWYHSGRHVFAMCQASDGGNVTVTLNFQGVYPFGGTIESVPSTKAIEYNLALVEIASVRATSPIDKKASKIITTGTSTEIVTGALTQTDNLILYSHGNYVGYSSGAPSGYTSMLSTNFYPAIGGLLAYRKITSASSQTITQAHSAADTANGGWAIVLRAAESAGGAYRYKLRLDSTTFDETDTGLTVYIWRNKAFEQGAAEKYTGQAGEVDGTILVDTGLPPDVASTDTITFLVISGDGTTRAGPGVGTVEAV